MISLEVGVRRGGNRTTHVSAHKVVVIYKAK